MPANPRRDFGNVLFVGNVFLLMFAEAFCLLQVTDQVERGELSAGETAQTVEELSWRLLFTLFGSFSPGDVLKVSTEEDRSSCSGRRRGHLEGVRRAQGVGDE